MGVCGSKSIPQVQLPRLEVQTEVRMDAGSLKGSLQSSLLDLKKVRKVRSLNLERNFLFQKRRESEKSKTNTPCTASGEWLAGQNSEN